MIPRNISLGNYVNQGKYTMFNYSDHSELNQALDLLIYQIAVLEDDVKDAIKIVKLRFKNINIDEVLNQWQNLNC